MTPSPAVRVFSLVFLALSAPAAGLLVALRLAPEGPILVPILGTLAASGLLAWVLAGHLQAPGREFQEATRRLAAGDFEVRLPEERGQPARDFNALAEALGENERSRRQWVADTSHELRTPLAVLRAQIEALVDGVQPADAETLGTLQGEVQRLTGLVDDLYMLARSDSGALPVRPEGTDMGDLAREVAARFEDRYAQAGLDLEVLAEGPSHLNADPARLRQVLVNLLENSLRYTERGGTVRVSVGGSPQDVRITVDDSAPGVAEEHLPHLFDRFYRVEKSRTREHGGSGLGLAICRSLVEAHGGSISAGPSPLGGLRVAIAVPREGRARRGR